MCGVVGQSGRGSGRGVNLHCWSRVLKSVGTDRWIVGTDSVWGGKVGHIPIHFRRCPCVLGGHKVGLVTLCLTVLVPFVVVS